MVTRSQLCLWKAEPGVSLYTDPQATHPAATPQILSVKAQAGSLDSRTLPQKSMRGGSEYVRCMLFYYVLLCAFPWGAQYFLPSQQLPSSFCCTEL